MSCQSCNETPLSTNYTLPECAEGTSCEELFDTECTKYSGPNLISLGIYNQMSLKEALVALNKKLTQSYTCNTYTITVSSSQSKTTVNYINNLGNLVTKTVTSSQSPVSFCAHAGSAVKISGSGVLSGAGATCSNTTT